MAFLKFSRDKRGYEVFALVQPEPRGGQSRPRVLYAFRTPPNVKVGREPFDDETKKALEAANPGVGFNWRQIQETPVPSADAEMWRERRRAMKEAKLAAKKDKQDEEAQQRAANQAGQQPAPPGESRSARRRRRRKGRHAGVPPEGNSRSQADAADLSAEAHSGSQMSEGGSENPKIDETPADAAGDSEQSS